MSRLPVTYSNERVDRANAGYAFRATRERLVTRALVANRNEARAVALVIAQGAALVTFALVLGYLV